MVIKEIPAADTWPIRQTVMWPDKPLQFVKIADDEAGLHYGLFLNEQLTSVVSCFETQGDMQFRKFATLNAFQGQGLGTHLLNFVIAEARRKGVKRLWCNARLDKKGFYEKFGLTEPDAARRFEKEGIAYARMEMALW